MVVRSWILFRILGNQRQFYEGDCHTLICIFKRKFWPQSEEYIIDKQGLSRGWVKETRLKILEDLRWQWPGLGCWLQRWTWHTLCSVKKPIGFQNELDARNNKKGNIKDCSYISNLNKGWMIFLFLDWRTMGRKCLQLTKTTHKVLDVKKKKSVM